ncbi:MAG: ABC transporter substrate-binding protein [Myxococcota bacterium]
MRLVSLCPSTTESLVAFGLHGQLAGITRFCIHPREVVSKLTKVGGTKDPKLERIAEIAPDLIFMNREENRSEDHAWLSARFEVDVSLPRGPEDVPPLLRRWGARLSVQERADAWADAIEARLENPPRRSGTVPFLYVIWRRPWMVAGSETYVDRMMRWGGGINVAPSGDYPEVDLSEFAHHEGLQVLLPDEPFPFKAPHREELKSLLPRARVRLLGGDDCCWHGVRTLRGLDLVSSLFEP